MLISTLARGFVNNKAKYTEDGYEGNWLLLNSHGSMYRKASKKSMSGDDDPENKSESRSKKKKDKSKKVKEEVNPGAIFNSKLYTIYISEPFFILCRIMLKVMHSK